MNAPSVDTSRALSAAEQRLVEQLRLTRVTDDNVVRFEPKERPTPPTTIEALMFGLRRGLACLEDPGNRDRLRRCDIAAMTEIAGRLTALGWPDERIEKVILAWRAVGGGRS
jgi:hypothetical protein